MQVYAKESVPGMLYIQGAGTAETVAEKMLPFREDFGLIGALDQ